MRNPQDNFDRQVRTLTAVILLKLDDLSKEDEEFSQIANLDEYRKDLAEAHPEMAQRFEQLTSKDANEALRQVSMAEAMAYAIVWALDNDI